VVAWLSVVMMDLRGRYAAAIEPMTNVVP